MYMCVKLPFGDLNPGHCPSHLTNTYTYEVTVVSRVCSGTFALLKGWKS